MEETRQTKGRRRSLALSLALVLLVSFAVAGSASPLFFAIACSAPVAAMTLQWLFPESRLLWIAFMNLIAVYGSVFALFVDEVFSSVTPLALGIGFVVPVLLFLVGCAVRRNEIRLIVSYPGLRGDRGVLAALTWLAPVFLVGAGVLVLSRFSPAMADNATAFHVSMSLIGLIVVAASRDVAIFLVDTGLLFEEFFKRIAHLVIPAFAFLTFYSLLVIVFAAIYRVISVFSEAPHFKVGFEIRHLTFPEALHFSVVTFSTVGYGDIVPTSSLARSAAAVEVVIGIVLLLFGVSEILDYSRERRSQRRRD